MRCPMAISTIMTFCAGTDRACDVGTITHVHLFKVANNVLTIDIEQGQHYELLVPADKDSRGLWHRENLQASEPVPEFKHHIDPFVATGFYSLGVFQGTNNATTATLRRLAGGDRIAVCRIDPPENIQGTAWLALPWSRASAQVWNQPLDDAPSIPLPWVTCFLSMMFLQWAKNSQEKNIPFGIVQKIVKASLLTDTVLWIALGVYILEDSTVEDGTRGNETMGAYFGLFFATLLIKYLHIEFPENPYVHVGLGFAALFTSALYVSTLFLWIWALRFMCFPDDFQLQPQTKVVKKHHIGQLAF